MGTASATADDHLGASGDVHSTYSFAPSLTGWLIAHLTLQLLVGRQCPLRPVHYLDHSPSTTDTDCASALRSSSLFLPTLGKSKHTTFICSTGEQLLLILHVHRCTIPTIKHICRFFVWLLEEKEAKLLLNFIESLISYLTDRPFPLTMITSFIVFILSPSDRRTNGDWWRYCHRLTSVSRLQLATLIIILLWSTGLEWRRRRGSLTFTGFGFFYHQCLHFVCRPFDKDELHQLTIFSFFYII